MRKFRGLDPRTRPARWGLLAIALGIVIGATGPQAAGQVGLALATQHDNLPWYLSRLLSFLALLAITGSVVYGLLLSTGILDAVAHRPITFTLHQDLGAVGLGLAAIHGALLGLDRVVPISLLELAVPFASPYRPIWVGIGQVGLYLIAVVHGSFYVRRRIGQRTWRRLHYLTFLAFVASVIHGVLSGTDSNAPWAWLIYASSAAIVTILLIIRVVLSMSGRRAGGGNVRAKPAAGSRIVTPRALPVSSDGEAA